MIVSWQKEFQKDVLDRGFADYQDGTVTGLKKTSDGFEASVAEGKLETVRIHAENGIIRSMKCTCDEARQNGQCRHVVAVLMTLDEMLPKPLVFEIDEGTNLVEVKLQMSEGLWKKWQALAQVKGESVETLILEQLKKIG